MKEGCDPGWISSKEAGRKATVAAMACSPARGSITTPVGWCSGARAAAIGLSGSVADAVAAIMDSLRSPPDSVPQPPMARADTANSSAACRMPNPKRTFRVPLELWLASLMGSLAEAGGPGTKGARPVPRRATREHRIPSVIVSSTFPAIRRRHGPHL